MGNIIDTGLGWYANETWLKEAAGIIGKMGNGTILDTLKPIPFFNKADFPSYTDITQQFINSQGFATYGARYAICYDFYHDNNSYFKNELYVVLNSQYYAFWFTKGKLAQTPGINPSIYFTQQAGDYSPNWGIGGTMSTPYSGGIYGLGQFANNPPSWASTVTWDKDLLYLPNATTIPEVVSALTSGGGKTSFYKLNQGYSVACFITFKNRNLETITAPVLISTEPNNVIFSLDGSTEASGLITGIEYGGKTFYLNIMLNYTGDVESYVPYEDITDIYPDGANITDLFRAIATLAQIRFDDPYAGGGNSGSAVSGGSFDSESDVIGVPSLPSVSFSATGFTRIYNPTLAELNALANYLWTDTTFLDTVINHLKQLLENPMDAIISLSLLPCQIPNGSPESVKVMYINTGVSMAPATTQFVDVDCGTFTLQEFYGSALDYNPYTKVHCYLPYIGQVTLDTDEVMGKTIHVRYRIDIVTGMCAALISVNQSAGSDETVMYQFSGHCSINMPINSADFSGYIGAAMTAGKMVAGVVAGASGNIPLAAELIGAPAPHSSTSETNEKTTERNPKTGRQITTGTSTRTTTRNTPGASFGEMSRKAAANTVGAVMGSKLTVEHAGGFTGNSGYLAVRRPYLIIERPRMCNPEEYGKYNGRPSMIYMNLGECSGYTEVQSIQFDGISATNPELAELSELLKSGVLF